jgi:hypothetical protein
MQDTEGEFNKEIEVLKQIQIEILEIKSSINQIKKLSKFSSVHWIKSGF